MAGFADIFCSLYKSSRKVKTGVSLFLILAVGVFAFSGCQKAGPGLSKAVAVDVRPDITLPKPEDRDIVTVSLVGDIMVHSDQLAAAHHKGSGKYSFEGFFTEVKPFLSSADLTIGNLETTLAGSSKGYTGYPKFNSPQEILRALRWSGFDVLTTANNHAMDRKKDGVLKTIDYLDAAGIKHTGTFSSAAERNEPLIIDIKGLKIGILAYTYGTNGLQIPRGSEYLVNLLNPERVREDIRKAREKGADIILVNPHFGVEYRRSPNEAGQRLVEELFASGADIVAGSHPHVLQLMTRRDRQKDMEGFFAAYSLGNFISAQMDQYRDSGVILNFKIEKDPASGKARLIEANYIPTWVHVYRENGKIAFRVLAVEKAIRDYEQGLDKKLTEKDYIRLKQVWLETTSLISGPLAPDIYHV